MTIVPSELKSFMENWAESPEGNKKAFTTLLTHLEEKGGIRFEFIPREGVTYSLRAGREGGQGRDFFVMIDVIEDTPRWLSVCFYNDMVTDSEENGDFVPEGLLGDDALCFDVEENKAELLTYIQVRLDEAWQAAGN